MHDDNIWKERKNYKKIKGCNADSPHTRTKQCPHCKHVPWMWTIKTKGGLNAKLFVK